MAAEAHAAQAEGEYWHARQLGLMIAEAAIILKAGLIGDLEEAAEHVGDYAFGVRLGATADSFNKIMQTINK